MNAISSMNTSQLILSNDKSYFLKQYSKKELNSICLNNYEYTRYIGTGCDIQLSKIFTACVHMYYLKLLYLVCEFRSYLNFYMFYNSMWIVEAEPDPWFQ